MPRRLKGGIHVSPGGEEGPDLLGKLPDGAEVGEILEGRHELQAVRKADTAWIAADSLDRSAVHADMGEEERKTLEL